MAPVLLRWGTLTKTRFDRLDRARCVVLVTCSPLEVHGPHLARPDDRETHASVHLDVAAACTGGITLAAEESRCVGER